MIFVSLCTFGIHRWTPELEKPHWMIRPSPWEMWQHCTDCGITRRCSYYLDWADDGYGYKWYYGTPYHDLDKEQKSSKIDSSEKELEKMSLRTLSKNRHEKAYAAVPFVGVEATDNHNRPIMLLAPGSDGKQYRVVLVRLPDNVIQCNCHLVLEDHLQVCQGQSSTVCYHSIAAVLKSMSVSKLVGNVCDTMDDAERVSRTSKDSVIVTLVSQTPNAKKVFVVVKNK